MSVPLKVTVVLCTFNRCQFLEKVLQSLSMLVLPDSVDWEVVVVDNNSSDQTRVLVEDFCRRYPERLRYVFEPQPGLSHARNAGIREARGDIIAFTDDDVLIPPTWLQALTAGLRDGQWAGAGGRILPEQTFVPPSWLRGENKYALAPLPVFDLGPDAERLFEPPFGANMAFRKEMFIKYGHFRTDLGRSPGNLMSNEDTEFGHRLLSGGEQLRYEPAATIYHPISENRLQKKYFLAWWYDKGRADIRTFGVRPAKWYLSGIPLYLFRNLAVWTFRWMVATRPGMRFQRKLTVWGKVGEITECYRQAIDPERRR